MSRLTKIDRRLKPSNMLHRLCDALEATTPDVACQAESELYHYAKQFARYGAGGRLSCSAGDMDRARRLLGEPASLADEMTPDEARDVLAGRRPGCAAAALYVLGQSVAAEKDGRPRLPLATETPAAPESKALGGRLYGPDGLDERGWEKAMADRGPSALAAAIDAPAEAERLKARLDEIDAAAEYHPEGAKPWPVSGLAVVPVAFAVALAWTAFAAGRQVSVAHVPTEDSARKARHAFHVESAIYDAEQGYEGRVTPPAGVPRAARPFLGEVVS